MKTETFKGIIFLPQFIQGNTWPFSITWLKLNLQIPLSRFYWFAPIQTLWLWKLFFLSTHIQVIWNDDPQLEVNSKFFSLLLKEIYTLKKKTQLKNQRKSCFLLKRNCLYFSFFRLLCLPHFLCDLYEFFHNSLGKDILERLQIFTWTFWPFPYSAAAHSPALPPVHSSWQFLSLLLQ